jgi:hypothetical protein
LYYYEKKKNKRNKENNLPDEKAMRTCAASGRHLDQTATTDFCPHYDPKFGGFKKLKIFILH